MTTLKENIEKLRSELGADMMVTNLKSPKEQRNYYCLIISETKLEILEKSRDKKSKLEYELSTGNVVLNNQEIQGYNAVFSKKLKMIIGDLNSKKAIITPC